MKYNFNGKRCVVDYDHTDPKDEVKVIQKEFQGKTPATLSPADRIKIFDAYFNAGIIKL